MESQWYYTLSGQQKGPVSEGELQSLLKSGQVPANEFVFKEGMADWALASSRAELVGGLSPAGGPPGMPAAAMIAPRATGEISIGNVYQEAFAVFKESWIPLCLGFLITLGISMGGGFVCGIISAIVKDQHNVLGNLLSLVINGPLTLGMWILVLGVVDRKQMQPTVVLEGFKHFLPAFVLNLLLMVAMLAGLLALIIGIFVVAILLSFAWLYMADRQVGPVEAMKQSFECVKSNFLTVFVLMLLWIPICIAGLLAFIVGIIPAGIFCWLTIAVAYRWLNPQMPASS